MHNPVPLSEFVSYGREFARRFVPELEEEQIKCIDHRDDHFQITTGGGERFLVRSVVVAIGLSYQEHVPPEFRHLPSSRVTHTSQHGSYAPFAGRDVTVLGSGPSAFDAAVLLEEAGAQVTLIARARKPAFDLPNGELTHRGGEGFLTRPTLHSLLPSGVRRVVSPRTNRFPGDAALHRRRRSLNRMPGCRVLAAEPADGGCERVRLTVADGRGQSHRLLTSHLILATGYRFDKNRLQVLSQSLREQIRVRRTGALRLNSCFESSVPCLFFVGPVASPVFGPRLQSLEGIPLVTARVTERLRKLGEREVHDVQRDADFGGLGRRQRVF